MTGDKLQPYVNNIAQARFNQVVDVLVCLSSVVQVLNYVSKCGFVADREDVVEPGVAVRDFKLLPCLQNIVAVRAGRLKNEMEACQDELEK